MRPYFLFALFGAFTHGAFTQCPPTYAILGNAEAVSTGPETTPFPTSLGLGSRVQYVYPSDLVAAGDPCAFTQITGIGLQVLSADEPGTTATLQVRMKNTLTSDCTYQNTGLTDLVAELSTYLDTGLLVIPFSTPFSWTGPGNDLLVEIALLRSGGTGGDPAVAIDTGYVNVGRYGFGDGDDPVPGWAIPDFELQGTAIFGCTTYLPVMGFFGSTVLSVATDAALSTSVRTYPNPVDDLLTVDGLGDDVTGLALYDTTGRLVLHRNIGPHTGIPWTIALPDVAPGLYRLVQRLANGAQRDLGALVVR